MTYPTGEQYEIVSGEQRAVITEVGATLRTYTVGGRHVVRGFEADEVVHKGRGQQLLPWPNRIRDGLYTFGGEEQQLDLSEPDRHNALHGLVRHVVWDLMDFTGDAGRHLAAAVRLGPPCRPSPPQRPPRRPPPLTGPFRAAPTRSAPTAAR